MNMNSEKEKLCCFIVPYFGKLPDTMAVFLKSCEHNREYNWIIFTNDETPFNYPSNVKVIKYSFESMRQRIQECFNFKISLDTPKKLCDFKPAYGYIFANELVDFRFWGYCDLDQYFGKLEDFIPKKLLEGYDKLFSLGHMTIYRNVPKINKLFMCYLNNDNYSIKSYKKVFSEKGNMLFDEWPKNTVNINVLAQQEKIRIYYKNIIDDIKPYKSSFFNTVFVPESRQWKYDLIDKHVIV